MPQDKREARGSAGEGDGGVGASSDAEGWQSEARGVALPFFSVDSLTVNYAPATRRHGAGSDSAGMRPR